MRVMIDEWTVEVTRRRMKNMYLRVSLHDGSIRVSAPTGVSDERIAAFVRARADWLRGQLSRVGTVAHTSTRAPLCDGKTLVLLGKSYPLRVRLGAPKSALTLLDGVAYLALRTGTSDEARDRFIKEWLRAQLSAQIERYLPKWETITGLHPTSWQIKDMKTRWGTCNVGTRKLWLNLHLVQKPTVCLEYVILHELTHLRVPDHGAAFKAHMDRFMPAWRDVRRALNGK